MAGDPEFRSLGAKRFFDYWNSLPKRGLLPDRQDFDPVAIRDLMPMTVMIEYREGQEAEFRFIGTRLAELAGYDATKQKYIDVLDKSAFGAFVEASENMLGVPCGGQFIVTVQAATGFTTRYEAVDLPLHNSRGRSLIVAAYLDVLGVVGTHREKTFRILTIEQARWIDIGAGVPGA